MNSLEFETLLTEAIKEFHRKMEVQWLASNPRKTLPPNRKRNYDDIWEFYFRGNNPLRIHDSTITLVDQVGGEGQGNHAHLVFRVDKENEQSQWFRKDGFYNSYDSTNWDDDPVYEVTPQERTIVVYE